MGKQSFILSIVAAGVLLASALASAGEYKINDLIIKHQTIRATVQTANVAAGYLEITNNGLSEDRLLGGAANFAGKVDVHEMKMTDGVMKMRPLAGGLVIPPGETVILKSGAEHLMFMKLKEPMTEGEMRTVTLNFEKAGSIDVMFPVGNLAGGHSH